MIVFTYLEYNRPHKVVINTELTAVFFFFFRRPLSGYQTAPLIVSARDSPLHFACSVTVQKDEMLLY